MIRRIIVSLGLVCIPLSAHAQQALSPWVQEVIDRASQGIGTAQGIGFTSGCDPVTLLAEVQDNITLTRQAQTAILTLEAESQALRARTVCYEYDRRLLQEKMKEVLEEMDVAVEACNLGTNKSLRSVYEFLAGAYSSFVFGGANPSYKDDRLKYQYPFHDSSLSEPVYDSGATVPVCAFTSDYAPHAIAYVPNPSGLPVTVGVDADIKSFGCDEDVLGSIQPPFNDEASAHRQFIQKTDTFSRNVYDIVSMALLNMSQFFEQISGNPIDELPGAKPPAPHEEVTGCLRPLNPDSSLAGEQEWEDLFHAYPEYFDPDKGNKDASGVITFGPATPEETLPVGLLFMPVVDYFRAVPDVFTLLGSFTDRRADAGLSRPLPKEFVNQRLDSYISVLERKTDSERSLRYIGSNIELQMAFMEANSRDSIETMKEASEPLAEAVNSLIYVVTEFLPGNTDNPAALTREEGYIPQLTYFLARSCVDGHCPQTLNTVAKRIYNPYCRPYVSGLYLEDDAHKRCYCDPSIQGDWDKFDTYCTDDYSSDQAKYDALVPELFPGCTEEGLGGSSSSSSVTP